MSRGPVLWGLAIALVGLLADQGVKLALLYPVRLAETGPIALAPFLELRLIWNYGISYGLFQQDGDVGRWVLVGVALVASLGMLIWITRAGSLLLALSLGLVVGGAIGNAIDRIVWGAVIDYVHLFLPSRAFSWYVFNLADVWIVVGVIGLLYDSLVAGPKDATKSGSS
jgi:signal peptidase II